MTNWNGIKIRCSALGSLLTQPQSKVAKDAGELSETTKSYLVSVYIEHKYGRKKDIQSKYLEKGKLAEEDSIDLLSKYEKEFLQKNEDWLQNDYISGTPDIFRGETIHTATEIIDIKTSWNLETFLSNVAKPLNPHYIAQLNGYMALSGANTAWICYCLTSAPNSLVEDEKRKLLYRMNVVSDESPEYKLAALELENDMIFEDISINERILKFRVDRDDEMIENIYQKVRKAREFLADFELKHMNFNTK